VSRSPLLVLSVVGALGLLFAMFTARLVRREELRHIEGSPPCGHVPSVERVRAPGQAPRRTNRQPRRRTPRQPRVRTPVPPRQLAPPEPSEVYSEPDPRRPSLVLNLEAFTEFRSR
jgi:hypothetical protein